MDIYSGNKENDVLISLLKKWYPKAPKKSNSKLINDVHQLLMNANSRDLFEILCFTKYFENTLWKFFHQDITSNHIELMVCLILYDIDKGYGKFMDIVLSDEDVFLQLLERLLSITIAPYKQHNLRLQRNCMLFINQLITFKLAHPLVKKSIKGLFDITIWSNVPNYEKMLSDEDLKNEFDQKNAAIEDCESASMKSYFILKRRWAFTITSRYMTSLESKEMIENTEFLRYLESLIQLFISCVSQLPIRIHFNTFLKCIRFISCFHLVDTKNKRLFEFVKILKHFMYFPINDLTGEEYLEGNKYQDNFYKLQKLIYEAYNESQGEKIKDFVLVPSVYNYSPEELKEFLSKFQLTDLTYIANKLCITDHILPNSKNCRFVIDTIVCEVFTPQYNIKSFKVEDYTEVDIMDDFNELFEGYLLLPMPLPEISNTQYLSVYDYILRETIHMNTDLKRITNKHIIQVLERLKLSVDAQNNLRIKGNSKYFSRIDSLHVTDRTTAEMTISNGKDWKENVKANDYVILLHLMKPNKYAALPRLGNYGLNLLRFKKLVSVSNKGKQTSLIVKWNENDELSNRFNYIIRLPSEGAVLDKLKVFDNNIDFTNIILPEFLNDLYLGIAKPTIADFKLQADRPYNLKINCINSDQLNYNFKCENQKRRKTNDNKISGIDPPFILNFNNNDDQVKVQSIFGSKSNYELNDEQARCIVPSISTGLTVIDAPPNSDGQLIQSIIDNLQFNFPNERTLIICPNYTYLDKFEIKSVKFLRVYSELEEYDEQINGLFDLIAVKLTQTEELSTLIGLDDMGFGATCENALLLLPKIKMKWENFLHSIKDDKLKVANYPFKEFSKLTLGEDFETDLRKVIASYKEIMQLFQDIQRLAPLVKFLLKRPELIKYLIHRYSQYVSVTPYSLISQNVYQSNFDSIICIGAGISQFTSVLPMLNNLYLRRCVVLGDFSTPNKSRWKYLRIPRISLHKVSAREELIGYYNENYNNQLTSVYNGPSANGGFKYTHQIITLELDSDDMANVNEAEYSVALFQYMRLLGYPAGEITIIVMTPHQKVLMEEILVARCGASKANDSHPFQFGRPVIELDDSTNPNAYLIVSAFGRKSAQLQCLVNATHGIYIVGAYSLESFPQGNLGIVSGEMYNRLIKREPSQLYDIVGYEHLRQYVDQMTVTRGISAK